MPVKEVATIKGLPPEAERSVLQVVNSLVAEINRLSQRRPITALQVANYNAHEREVVRMRGDLGLTVNLPRARTENQGDQIDVFLETPGSLRVTATLSKINALSFITLTAVGLMTFESNGNGVWLCTTAGEGTAGQRGVAGATGASGATGSAGASGQSIPGEQGPQGDQGDPGPPGAQGASGRDGPPGPQGDIGDQGDQGPPGAAGPTGADGAAGARGNDGAPGQQGDTGDQGDPGPPGPAGATGATGNDGAAGARGNDGAPGQQGDQGNDGDVGPPGPKGDKGDTGAMGPQGEEGPEGPDGSPGSPGAVGATGATGDTGPAGVASTAIIQTSVVNFGATEQTSGSFTVTGLSGLTIGTPILASLAVTATDPTESEQSAVLTGIATTTSAITFYWNAIDGMQGLHTIMWAVPDGFASPQPELWEMFQKGIIDIPNNVDRTRLLWQEDFECVALFGNPVAVGGFADVAGGNTNWGATSVGNAGTITAIDGTSGHPGVLTMTSGGVAGNAIKLYRGQETPSSRNLIVGTDIFDAVTVVQISSSLNIYWEWGFVTNPFVTYTNCAIFYYDTAVGGTIHALSQNGTLATATDTNTGIAYTNNQWYVLRISQETPGTIKYYINDALVATHTSGPPTAGAMNFAYTLNQKINETSKTMRIDFVGFQSQPLGARYD